MSTDEMVMEADETVAPQELVEGDTATTEIDGDEDVEAAVADEDAENEE